jgi:hypothetical protein
MQTSRYHRRSQCSSTKKAFRITSMTSRATIRDRVFWYRAMEPYKYVEIRRQADCQREVNLHQQAEYRQRVQCYQQAECHQQANLHQRRDQAAHFDLSHLHRNRTQDLYQLFQYQHVHHLQYQRTFRQ